MSLLIEQFDEEEFNYIVGREEDRELERLDILISERVERERNNPIPEESSWYGWGD